MKEVIIMKDFNEFKSELKTKKIAVLGAGVSNVPLIKYLTILNCDITLFDKKELTEIDADIKQLIKNNTIKAHLGKYPEAYKDLQFTILRILPKTISDKEAVMIESLYKRKLNTRNSKYGMNLN